jgi:hypothetical protein
LEEGIMTNAQTQEVLEMEGVSLSQALGFHLTSRCFPAPHRDFYPAIIQGINEVAKRDYGTAIPLPNGRVLTAEDIVEQLRLWDFVEALREGGAWS